jgi:hypothetical protein
MPAELGFNFPALSRVPVRRFGAAAKKQGARWRPYGNRSKVPALVPFAMLPARDSLTKLIKLFGEI